MSPSIWQAASLNKWLTRSANMPTRMKGKKPVCSWMDVLDYLTTHI